MTVEQRALQIVATWFGEQIQDSNTLLKVDRLVDLFVFGLKEQDKMTRQAIAAALGAESENGEIGLTGNYAQEIAMNTSAL